MRTVTIPIDLDTALALLAPEPVLIELTATGPGVALTIGAARLIEEAAKTTDPPPTPAPASKAVAKKVSPTKKAAPAVKSEERHVCDCGQVFATTQAIGVHRSRAAIHRTPIAAVPPPAPTPIRPESVTGPPPARATTTTEQPAPTRPSSMCDRGDHTMCKTAQARCNCTCHGRHGQQPPASAAS